MLKILQSSKNPEKLSLTLKGLIPLIAILVAIFGFDITQLEINDLIDGLIKAVVAVGSAVSAIAAFYGAIRKIKKRKKV